MSVRQATLRLLHSLLSRAGRLLARSTTRAESVAGGVKFAWRVRLKRDIDVQKVGKMVLS